MEKILLNMANNLLIDFCKTKEINCAGTNIVKDGRGFKYSLRDEEKKVVAQITFHKSQVPTFARPIN